MCLVLAYHLTGNERYIARAWKYAENMCLLEDFNPEITFLDVGELCFQVGLCYDWLYNWMDEYERLYIRQAIFKNGIMPIMDDFDEKEKSNFIISNHEIIKRK